MGAGARGVVQRGGDLAHPGQHVDVAVGQGVHPGRQCLERRRRLADAVLEAADITGEVRGVAAGSGGLSSVLSVDWIAVGVPVTVASVAGL